MSSAHFSACHHKSFINHEQARKNCREEDIGLILSMLMTHRYDTVSISQPNSSSTGMTGGDTVGVYVKFVCTVLLSVLSA